MSQNVLEWTVSQLDHGCAVALASVVTASGSVPGKPGAKMAINSMGEQFGTIGGAGLELQVTEKLVKMLNEEDEENGEVITYQLYKGSKGYETVPLDSLCGGKVTLSVEVIHPMPHILLMGGGHVAQAIGDTCRNLDWKYSVQDTRDEYASNDKFRTASELHSGSIEEFITMENEKSISRFSHIYLLGHDWKEDELRLIGLLKLIQNAKKNGFRTSHLGVIGSRAKWKAFEKSAIEAGIGEEIVSDVECPIGLNIGAESPQEIAIAVCASIISKIKEQNPDDKNWREAAK